MDTKTNERVLKALIETSNSDRSNMFSVKVVRDKLLQDLPMDKMNASISYLQDQGLVRIELVCGDQFVRVDDRAYGYFEKKQESENKKRLEKIENRLWDFVKMGASFILGYISHWLQSHI
jgi:hypothetical protein